MTEDCRAGRMPLIRVRSLVFFFSVTWLVGTLSDFFSNDVFGVLEGFSESILESLISLGSGLLGSLSLLVSLGFEGGLSSLGSVSLSLGDKLCSLLGKWIQLEHHCLVIEWVLLGLVVLSN